MPGYRYKIHGYENQVLEVTLEPGQRIQAEKGAMTFMEDRVRMNTRLGEQSGPMKAIKRKIAGEDLLINEFTNESNRPAGVALSPQRPSQIVRIDLDEAHPDIICKREAFLAGDTRVHVSIVRGAAGPMLLARGSLIMQRLHGEGTVFITGNGATVCKELAAGETLMSDLDALVAFDDTVEHGVKMTRGVRNMFLGGEGIFIVTTKGPGRVWMQSLSRFEVAKGHMRALMKHEAAATRAAR